MSFLAGFDLRCGGDSGIAFFAMHFPNLIHVEDKLWIAVASTGVPAYDYSFEATFACRGNQGIMGNGSDAMEITAVARMGATEDYPARYEDLRAQGVTLVHSPDEYRRTSSLPEWYPLIVEFTPKSVWYDGLPTAAEVAEFFEWPVFVKGERQTNRHNRRQCIIDGPDEFESLMCEWKSDPVLSWQRVVCREYIRLRSVSGVTTGSLPKSFEFRTFWWRGNCVGIGRYWVSESYAASAEDQREIKKIAGAVARCINVAFLVVDVAQSQSGEWLVVEINDWQDAGYAGVNPMLMWRAVLDHAGESLPTNQVTE